MRQTLSPESLDIGFTPENKAYEIRMCMNYVKVNGSEVNV